MRLTKALQIVALSIVGVCLPLSGHCQSFLTNGLVAYYPLNGNANDASGNGHNGITNAPTPTVDRFGSPNGALAFHGTGSTYGPGDIITIPGTENLNFLSGGFSLCAWISLSTYNEDVCVTGRIKTSHLWAVQNQPL